MVNNSSSHIIIFNKKGKVLLVKRADNDDWEPGKWSLPGGRRRKDETLYDNIIREVFEETGLTISAFNLKYLKDISQKLNHIFFTTNKFSGNIQLDQENSDFKWVLPEEIVDNESVPNLKEEVLAAKKVMSKKLVIKITNQSEIVPEITKVGMKGSHKDLDYYDMTSDINDGPRTRVGKKKAKRFAAKRNRRKAKKEIEKYSTSIAGED